jgi:hypothetical protein
MDWQLIKEKAWFGYGRASQFFLFCNALAYLAGCALAHQALGPVGYAGFIWHCCQWRGVH